ncbi:hypothetical protein WCO01_02150 [Weissella confusa]|nr:hypothetical protein WCO01_02150 [Weissella confusa]
MTKPHTYDTQHNAENQSSNSHLTPPVQQIGIVYVLNFIEWQQTSPRRFFLFFSKKSTFSL